MVKLILSASAPFPSTLWPNMHPFINVYQELLRLLGDVMQGPERWKTLTHDYYPRKACKEATDTQELMKAQCELSCN